MNSLPRVGTCFLVGASSAREATGGAARRWANEFAPTGDVPGETRVACTRVWVGEGQAGLVWPMVLRGSAWASGSPLSRSAVESSLARCPVMRSRARVHTKDTTA